MLAKEGLPDPDSIETPDQVQAFLNSALPQRLITRALRKLWGMNPILANVDGLVDYGEDYTDAALVVENMQTVYQVGKGMFDKFAKSDEADERATEPEADEPDDAVIEDTEISMETASSAPSDPPQTIHQADDPHPPPDLAEATPRRMRFRFET